MQPDHLQNPHQPQNQPNLPKYPDHRHRWINGVRLSERQASSLSAHLVERVAQRSSKHGCGHDLGLGVDVVFVVVGKRKGSILVRPSGGESGPGKEQAAWQVVGDDSMLPLSQVKPQKRVQ